MPTKPEATPQEAQYEVTIAATVRNITTGEVFNGSLEDLADHDNIEDVPFLTTQQSPADAIRDFLRSMSYDQDT